MCMRTVLTVEHGQVESFLAGAEASGVGFHATGQALARAIAAEGFDFSGTLGGPLGGGFYLADSREQAARHWTTGTVVEVAWRLRKPASHNDVLRVRDRAQEHAGPEPEDAFAWADWTQAWQNELSVLLQAESFDGATMKTRGGLIVCLYETADYRLIA